MGVLLEISIAVLFNNQIIEMNYFSVLKNNVSVGKVAGKFICVHCVAMNGFILT